MDRLAEVLYEALQWVRATDSCPKVELFGHRCRWPTIDHRARGPNTKCAPDAPAGCADSVPVPDPRCEWSGHLQRWPANDLGDEKPHFQ